MRRRRWQVGVCSGGRGGGGKSGPSRRAAVTCFPQLSFFTDAHANLPSPTSCQAALVFLGHAMGGAVGLRAPACLCQGQGNGERGPLGPSSCQPGPGLALILLCHLLQCPVGRCQSGELGNHSEKTTETEVSKLHSTLASHLVPSVSGMLGN